MLPEHNFIKINILFSLHVPETSIIVGWTCAVENRCQIIVICNHCASYSWATFRAGFWAGDWCCSLWLDQGWPLIRAGRCLWQAGWWRLTSPLLYFSVIEIELITPVFF